MKRKRPICDQYLSLLIEAIDDGEELSKDLKAHLESCPSCRNEWNRLKTIKRVIDSIEVVDVPDDFTDKVMARLDEPLPEIQMIKDKESFLPTWWEPLASMVFIFIFALFIKTPPGGALGIPPLERQVENTRKLFDFINYHAVSFKNQLSIDVNLLPELVFGLAVICFIVIFLLSRTLPQSTNRHTTL